LTSTLRPETVLDHGQARLTRRSSPGRIRPGLPPRNTSSDLSPMSRLFKCRLDRRSQQTQTRGLAHGTSTPCPPRPPVFSGSPNDTDGTTGRSRPIPLERPFMKADPMSTALCIPTLARFRGSQLETSSRLSISKPCLGWSGQNRVRTPLIREAILSRCGVWKPSSLWQLAKVPSQRLAEWGQLLSLLMA
jgi:hypothetical protein